MNDDQANVVFPVLKIATAWGAALGLKSWGDVASFLAALYTAALLGEWLWKKLWKKLRKKRPKVQHETT